MQKSTQVEAGSAYYDRKGSARSDVGEDVAPKAEIIACAEYLPGVGDIN